MHRFCAPLGVRPMRSPQPLRMALHRPDWLAPQPPCLVRGRRRARQQPRDRSRDGDGVAPRPGVGIPREDPPCSRAARARRMSPRRPGRRCSAGARTADRDRDSRHERRRLAETPPLLAQFDGLRANDGYDSVVTRRRREERESRRGRSGRRAEIEVSLLARRPHVRLSFFAPLPSASSAPSAAFLSSGRAVPPPHIKAIGAP